MVSLLRSASSAHKTMRILPQERRSLQAPARALLLGVLLASAPLARAATPALYTFHHPAMGTEFALYLYAGNSTRAAELAESAFDEIDRIEAELSNYREDSELSRINREAATHDVTTDPETFHFLQESQRWSVRSDGAFDITVGALMKAWGFFRAHGRVPSQEELQQLRPRVGYAQLALTRTSRTVRFLHEGVELDPGGIGKGFAVDAAIALLREQGVRAALLSAGSSTLYALGAPTGKRGWRILVPSPDAAARALTYVWLRDTSLSSANCREKHFTSASGHKYCHIMDPRTLRPVEGRLHVSIVHPSATASDALSNVLFVDTPEQSLTFLKRFAPESSAVIVMPGSNGHNACVLYRWKAKVNSNACAVQRQASFRP